MRRSAARLGLPETLGRLQRSRAGQFAQKLIDDRAPNLAVLLAWGALSMLLPAVLGLLALAGLVLRDPQRLDQLTSTLFALLPTTTATSLRDLLATTPRNAGTAGLISLLLLLFTGSNFFANMESVFNLAYHVPDRNPVMQRLLGLLLLLVLIVLAVISTSVYSLAAASDALWQALPFRVPGRGLLGAGASWAVSVLSATVMFLVLYRLLPHKRQSWRQALPGALLAVVLFFAILQVFPIYLSFFGQGFEAYAAFGIFLVLMFWLFLLGLVFVAGAELNAFLEEPGRASALAQTTARAEVGQVEESRAPGVIRTHASGSGRPGPGEPA